MIANALPEQTTSGAERIVETLEQLGVGVAFGLPGVHNLSIWRALSHSKLRLIGVRHEQTAVYAADGYARTGGNLGVALVTTGPGAANTLAATGEAWASGSPVVVVATEIPSHLRRPGTYRGVLSRIAGPGGDVPAGGEEGGNRYPPGIATCGPPWRCGARHESPDWPGLPRDTN